LALLDLLPMYAGAGFVYGWVLTWMPHLVIPSGHTPGGVDVEALGAIARYGSVVPIAAGVALVAWRLFLERPLWFPADSATVPRAGTSWGGVLHVVLETWSTRLVLLGIGVGLALCAVPRLFSVIPDDLPHLLPALGPVVVGIPGYTLAMRQGKALLARSGRNLLSAAMQVVAYAGGVIIVLLGFLLAAYLSASRGPGPSWGSFDTASWALMCGSYLVLTGLFTDEVVSGCT
jgi:hypothetical protein